MRKILILTSLILNTVSVMAQINSNNTTNIQNTSQNTPIAWQSNRIGAVFCREGGASPEGTFRFTSNGYEVFTIHSADKSFQPASLYYGVNDADKAEVDALAPDGKVPTAMNCFAVKTPEGVLLIDTGLPASNGGQALQRLESLNIHPSDVKRIYITHGHFDHIGGLLNETGEANYPNATVYISADELAFIRETMKDTASKIEKAYNGRLIAFGFGEILPGNVLPISAKGHTPGHTAYLIGSLLFVGDIMHGESIQLLDPNICANFDKDRAQAIATRTRILKYAASNSLTVLGAHIPGNGVIF